MKKIFTLFAVLLCAVVANAQTYEWYVDDATETQKSSDGTKDFFTVVTGGGFNAKYTGTYVTNSGAKIVCNKGLKLNSSSSFAFTTERSSTVVIVQCTSANDSKTFAFDGEEVAEGGVLNPEGCTTVKVFTFSGVPAGDHTFTNVGETGVMYLSVVLDELAAPQLDAPEITFSENTGEVTISEVTGAVKVVYTTDGSIPTEESEVYTAPFIVKDGTVVKAVAIGDDVKFSTSSVASVDVWLVGLTVSAPALVQFNGTFALSCETAHSVVEYSLDGEKWETYSVPVTLFETTKIKTRATRDKWTNSEVVEVEVEALPAVESHKTFLLGWGSFTESSDKKTLNGVNEAEGFALSMEAKTWNSQKHKINMGGEERTEIYGSNGAEVTFTIPEGTTVTRITFYSYLSSVTARNAGWSEVEGVTNHSADLVPMGSTDPSKPDVRVFNIENGVGSITFKNAGERPNFVMAVDVVYALPELPAIKIDGDEHNGEEIVLEGANKTIVLTAANEGHNLYYHFAEANAPASVKALAEAAEPVATMEHEGKTFSIVPAEGIVLSKAGTLSFFAHDPATNLKSEVKTLAVSGSGETTGIENVSVDAAVEVEYFNLQGIRVANPENGVFIRRQGKEVKKVVL